jgi:pyruvate ferredoxin oxidoreductase alpha subunit
MLEDADYVLVMTNSFSTLGKAAVNNARERGINAGLLRLRLVRPFPVADLKAAITGKRAVAVIDQNISIGKGGILHSEIASCLYNEKHRPLLLSFIAGLGGKNISPDEFEFIFNKMIVGVDTGEVETTQLLYTEKEWQEMERLKGMAGKG